MTLSDRDPMHQTISRRSVLRYAAAVPAAFAVGGLLAACGGGSNGGSSGGGGSDHTVNMTDALKYEPETITIKKGDSITWKNTGQLDHTATDDPSKAKNAADAKLPSGAQAWDSGDVGPGKTFKHTFDVVGDYTYFCIPHEEGGMVAHVTVQ
ncbi:MAG TPA: plastocyanin/azurin family copper-binding protein [Thermomicrobiaceae bacterium]|nr:plastocyanin/azurin family copper-binding protein [Thermomicrobiaceae bacterium]